MEIRRKVFSLLENEEGEARYYSTTEFELEFDEETGEKYFSEKEDDNEDEEESKIKKSGRGYVTSMRANGLILGPAAVAAGRKAAKKAEKEGKSESEQIEAAGKKAARVAAATNLGAGALGAAGVGAIYNKVAKNPEIRRTIKEGIKNSSLDKEAKDAAMKAGKWLGKKGRVGKIAAASLVPVTLGAAIVGSRSAGNGARKNVTKSLTKSHKEEKED